MYTHLVRRTINVRTCEWSRRNIYVYNKPPLRISGGNLVGRSLTLLTGEEGRVTTLYMGYDYKYKIDVCNTSFLEGGICIILSKSAGGGELGLVRHTNLMELHLYGMT